MSVGDVSQIVSEALWLIIKVGSPVLLISLCVGLIVSVFQTATSIQEQTLTFVPKVLSIFMAIIVLGNWMATEITDFITGLWNSFSVYIR
ncbi:MAG: flagellar biosynthesis protein FliQ [Lachnospiraceae bacterium]|nr:flagellar biosynthesis protein FliQ [Lachnospiraceae bacterium]